MSIIDISHPAPVLAPALADVSVDTLEASLVASEALIGRLRAQQLVLLQALDTAQVAALDGSRSMIEWTAARLDLTHDTARELVVASRTASDHPELAHRLAEGIDSFERTTATLRLASTGATIETIESSRGFDLAGVRRLASRHRRLTRNDERRVFAERFLAIQPTLDGSRGRLWAELPGADCEVVESALARRADALPETQDGVSDGRAQRMADALVAISMDALDTDGDLETHIGGTGTFEGPGVVVFTDAQLAAPTNGEAGSELASGIKAGPDLLDRILCEGTVQVVGLDGGRPVQITDATHAIPPAIRRHVLFRDGGCAIDGCRSRYRLQPHHIRQRRHGGDNDPDNLALLCWYHHHVVIHGHGRQLDPDSPPGRRRFLRPGQGSPAPPG